MKQTDETSENLLRPDWNSLEHNYEKHDAAEQHFLERLPSDVEAEHYGIDMRDEDGGLIYSTKPDFKLHSGDELQALVDVKCKSSDEWMKWTNERAHWNYVATANEYDVPMFLYFLSQESDDVIVVRADGNGDVLTTSTHDYIMPFPDRNKAAFYTETCERSWDMFLSTIDSAERE